LSDFSEMRVRRSVHVARSDRRDRVIERAKLWIAMSFDGATIALRSDVLSALELQQPPLLAVRKPRECTGWLFLGVNEARTLAVAARPLAQ
jgi:hypothetical protein